MRAFHGSLIGWCSGESLAVVLCRMGFSRGRGFASSSFAGGLEALRAAIAAVAAAAALFPSMQACSARCWQALLFQLQVCMQAFMCCIQCPGLLLQCRYADLGLLDVSGSGVMVCPKPYSALLACPKQHSPSGWPPHETQACVGRVTRHSGLHGIAHHRFPTGFRHSPLCGCRAGCSWPCSTTRSCALSTALFWLSTWLVRLLWLRPNCLCLRGCCTAKAGLCTEGQLGCAADPLEGCCTAGLSRCL